jgi:alpha-tubulin suppressor-like RCC1 family protein
MRRPLVLLLTTVAAVALPFAAGAGAQPSTEDALTGATQMDAFGGHTCVRLSSGQARCWGRNDDGQAGDGTADEEISDVRTVLAPTGSSALTAISQVAVGSYHSCALLASTQVRCWGYAADGQLGDGVDADRRPRARVVKNRTGTGAFEGAAQLGLGERHSCATLENGQVRCWGRNLEGQLGRGSTGGTFDLPQVVRNVADTGALTRVAQVDGGLRFTCARLTGGQVRCWGENTRGQLGNGTTDPSDTPVVVRLANGDPLRNVTQLSTGEQHVCARLESGRVRCWGQGTSGQLGTGRDDTDRHPQLVRAPTGTGPLTGVTQVDAAAGHSCARLSDGQARCWGRGSEGQLGWDSTSGNLKPVTVLNATASNPLVKVRQIRTGYQFTCAVLQNGQARCWGLNQNGELGDGQPGIDRDRPRVVVL